MATDEIQVREIIKQLNSTPGFSALPPESRNRMIQRATQEKFGTPPKSEGLLQSAVKGVFGTTNPMERLHTAAISGLPSAVAGVTPENAVEGQIEALPILGQIGGGVLGGYPGSIIGETLGDITSSGIQHVRGKENFSIPKIGMNTAITAGTEGLGRGIGKLFMGGAKNRIAVKEGMKQLGSMKEALRTAGEQNPNLAIPKQPILDTLNEMFSKSVNPKGPAASIFKDWIEIFSNPQTTHISPTSLLQMEEQFGQASKYFPEGSNFLEKVLFKVNNPIKDTVLNTGAKNVRNLVSGEVENVAGRAGIKDFGGVSRKFSEAKTATSGKSQNLLGQLITGAGDIGGGAMAGQALGGHPFIGAGVGILDMIRRNPAVQELVYKTIGRTGVGAGGTAALSEMMRKMSS